VENHAQGDGLALRQRLAEPLRDDQVAVDFKAVHQPPGFLQAVFDYPQAVGLVKFLQQQGSCIAGRVKIDDYQRRTVVIGGFGAGIVETHARQPAENQQEDERQDEEPQHGTPVPEENCQVFPGESPDIFHGGYSRSFLPVRCRKTPSRLGSRISSEVICRLFSLRNWMTLMTACWE